MNLTGLRKTKLTGQDIRNHQFPRKIRGYDTKELDAYLRIIADEMDGLISRNHQLTAQTADLERRKKSIQELDALLKRNLQAAAELHERTKITAEELLEDSREMAGKIIEQAVKESVRLRQESAEDVRRIRKDIASLENSRERSISVLMEFLAAQFHLLEQEAEHLGFDLSQIGPSGGKKIVPVFRTEELKGA